MRLRQLVELNVEEWLVLLQLVPIAAATKLALYLVPVSQLVPLLERIGRGLPAFSSKLDERRVYKAADWTARLPGGKRTCLLRSLLVHLMLCRRTDPSCITLGVMRRGADLRAHAWVTVHGQALCESEATLARFTPIAHLGQP